MTRSLRKNLTSSFQVATVASDSGRVYAAMKHGEVCQVGLSQYKVCLPMKTGFAGFGFWWLHFSSGDCAGGSQRACVAGTIKSPAFHLSFCFSSCAHHFWNFCHVILKKLELEKSWYDEKLGAGLHIVAAVTESCVTGHVMNWFRCSNYVCGWSVK